MSQNELCACGEPIATCPHLGIFKSAEEKAAHYANKPAREEDMAKLAELARQCVVLAERMRAADVAHNLKSAAEGVGFHLPYEKDLIQVADALTTIGPLVGYIPKVSNSPVAKGALDVMIQAARILLRVLTGK